MEALINDPQSQDLDALLIQEPSITTYRTHVNHSAWRLYRPTTQTDAVRFRSLIYVNRRLSTSSHRQIPCDHPDVAAIKIWSADSQILLLSVYIPPAPLFMGDDESALPALTAIQNTITTTLHNEQRPTNIILSGDFNRHHPLWGGNHIPPRFIEQAGDLIEFLQSHNLHSCLPRGTATYWALNNPGQNSTIDLTVTDKPERLVKCHLYHENYGSDHRATYSEWDLQPQSKPNDKVRKAYERADWARIGEEVARKMSPWKDIKTRPTLDRVVEKLTSATAQAVDQFTPDTRPAPYSKRWFTPYLKVQQVEVNQLRRRWQASCAELGRDHASTTAAFQTMQSKRRAWTRTIEKAKASHWKQFLDEAGDGKLWKAATYMKPRETWGCTPALKVGSQELTQNKDKARAFLEAFFPAMNTSDPSLPASPQPELPWHPITTLEIERSLKTAKGTTAPGEDNLPMRVWKKLWVYLKPFITSIFRACIDLGHHPKPWRSAKIIVLRKPGKPDYAMPGAYRPISLLNTLGKLLEAVMARRLSYLAEKHGLLPSSQFGGRPGRTTEQALLVLSNAIDQAWYKHKVVTLIAFDLKGAFNGVNRVSLDASLQARGIPVVARKWIASFMSDRHANIGFDDFRTETELLVNAGLAQGSPLSPILFAFFNADLVDQPVDSHGGASAFIDDYFRWRVGRSAEENVAKIQAEDIPRIEEWAQRTGSCFAAEKTELIHLTRKRGEHPEGVTFNGAVVKPSPTAKLLGVTFDQGLRWKEHVQQAIKRATKATIALSGLRHLRPEQMRQLYQACVTPIIDYASTVWHDPLRDKTHLRHLNTVQRTALIRILSAFRTVATATLEVEAHILPTHLRLRHRAQRTIARLHTLPRDHPIWSALPRAQNRRNNIGSYARFPLAEALKTMDVDRLNELETIDPRPLPPWRKDAFVEIELEPDRERARDRAESAKDTSDIVVYSDASGREGHLGAAVVALDDNDEVVESQQIQVGPMERWSVHVAELIGIFYAVNMVYKLVHQRTNVVNGAHITATILCDSRSALQAIQNAKNRSGQRIVHAILQTATEVQAKNITLRLQWMPGHCENAGNDAADRRAKEAAEPGKTHPFRPLLSRENAFVRSKIYDQWGQEWKTSTKGAHLRKIDGDLPAQYTRKLYGNLPRNRAYLLTQLRTGHNWLSSYRKKIGYSDDDRCECGAQETVSHVLMECPKLRGLRAELRGKVGDALNSVSSLLGGSNEGEKGKPDTVSRAKTVQAVLDFAEASQRFRSRLDQELLFASPFRSRWPQTSPQWRLAFSPSDRGSHFGLSLAPHF
ncbi:Probable transposable element [Penicillium roqueforti FM164]|uniref:Probable transposable element n=1 Tax=Penicillium roqueforti (strain FM164) TaxID=1365484 RepID=W6QR27_PENRF|nr:Probable transposable element [Penicillium roqueforti FM164]